MFINADERDLHADYEDWLEELASLKAISKYRHNRTGEDNGKAHLKRQVMGREVVVAITGGRLDLSRGNKSFTALSTAAVESVSWRKLSESKKDGLLQWAMAGKTTPVEDV